MAKNKKINYLDFFKTVGRSKRLLRSGWVREKVNDPESVAEHSFHVSVLAMVLSDKLGYNLDKNKLIKMAILHDLGEVITGDVVTQRFDLIDLERRDVKEKEEREGIKQIFSKIGVADEYLKIFDEMIAKVTPEAKVFWQFDKLEMALQAHEYEEEQKKDLEEFFTSSSLYLERGSLISKIFDNLMKKRKKKV